MGTTPDDDMREGTEMKKIPMAVQAVAGAVNVNLPIRVLVGQPALDALDERWDAVATASGAPVFRRGSFLRATARVEATDNVVVTLAEHGRRLVVGSAWVLDGACLRWLGEGPGDYLGPVIAGGTDAGTATAAIAASVRAVLAATDARAVRMAHVPDATGMASALTRVPGLHVTTLRRTVAPTMDMSEADQAVRKKSLKRHDNRLQREGDVRFDGWRSPDDVAARIDDLIALHRRRWDATPTPSEFGDARVRARFVEMALALAGDGVVRLHELRVDGTLVAAHLGFVDGARFVWYKPAFDPAWARWSPGEVLLRRLIMAAADEDVDEFDFTVGDEAFKLRFATRMRGVTDLHATFSPVEAARQRAWLTAKDVARTVLEPRGWWEPLRSVALR